MKFSIRTDQFVIQLQGFNTSASPGIWTCDTRPYVLVRLCNQGFLAVKQTQGSVRSGQWSVVAEACH